MAADVQSDPETEGSGLALDPFGFVPAHISRIIGLGGDQPGPDPYYVFHTPYVDCGTGPVLFTVQFEGLEATKGLISLRIHAYSNEPYATATMAGASQVSLRDLAVTGEMVALRIIADPDMVYALMGMVYDDTDAQAATLKVTVDRRGDSSPYASKLAEARRSVFGTRSIRQVAHLVSPDSATLAEPVSQMCTMAQFDEPVYGEWLKRMQLAPAAHRKQWEFVYIMRSLERYGMLQVGARGLGFGCGREQLPAVMAAMGCTVVATDLAAEDDRAAGWSGTQQHGASIEAMRYPNLCPDDVFDRNVSFRPVDMTDIPADLTDFDFTWSSCAYEHLGSIAAGLQFFEDSIRCLKPGGLAVHTTELNLTSNDQTLDEGVTVLFRRKDFERLALRLISTGHEVAQIKFDAGDRELDSHVDAPPYGSNVHIKLALGKYVTTSFGMIVRRGLR